MVYVRVKKVRNKDGTVRSYRYLVKSCRVGGRPRQEIIEYLGPVDDGEDVSHVK